MKETFSGREDLGLPKRLEAELPAILKWAITGQEMLRADGRFKVPKSSLHLLDDASSLASPVAMFVAEECSLGEGLTVSVDNLWVAWKAWADRNGQKPGTKQIFGRNLKPATGYKIKTTQPRDEGDARHREYEGIELRVMPPSTNGKPFTVSARGRAITMPLLRLHGTRSAGLERSLERDKSHDRVPDFEPEISLLSHVFTYWNAWNAINNKVPFRARICDFRCHK